MGKYRDRLQIIADILLIVSEGARKTRIMYQANLSYKLLCRYLSKVMDAGLVGCNDGDHYLLTLKGKEFLSRYGEYSKHCEHLEDRLNHVNNEKAILEQMCSNANAIDNDSARKKPQNKKLA